MNCRFDELSVDKLLFDELSFYKLSWYHVNLGDVGIFEKKVCSVIGESEN